jgi:rRNA maturation RNase YbeY
MSPNSTHHCTFQEVNVRSRLTQKRRLARFLPGLIFHYTNKHAFLSYTFLSDNELLMMNQQYLQHDTYTDIITFDVSPENAALIIGDIYISVDRVKENARHQEVTYPHELLRVIIHGALHLCGFKDKRKQDREHMRQLEQEWMLAFTDFK